jgi:uncharacterized membrane protein YkvA (DUF1232 family)
MKNNEYWEALCPTKAAVVCGKGPGAFTCPECGNDIHVEKGHAIHALDEVGSEFADDYSEDFFWEKVKRVAKKAGREVIEKALILYYALKDSDTPLWARTTIIGALGYFISPLDLIPDVIPVIGYLDDLAVMAAAIATVGAHITRGHCRLAKKKLKEWFGEPT